MTVLMVRGLSKSFFGFSALTDVTLALEPGEVHGLVGENGAGKSTLMKILAGVQQPDAGGVEVNDQPVHFSHPVQAYAAGIATVFQEFTLLPERTVAQNVFLGREPRRGGVVSRALMNRHTSDVLGSMGVMNIRPTDRVGDLSVAQQQIVEIAKALSYKPRVLSMDEPTAALADREVELLYTVVRRLAAQGVAVLYVSHRLREVFDLCDRITVLKDGALVTTTDTADVSEDDLVRLMVGRSLSTVFPPRLGSDALGDVALSLQDVGNARVDAITLEVRAGEIVGLAGLQGSGRTEILEGISGAARFTRGAVHIGGDTGNPRRPAQAIRSGVAHITEDRKGTGLALGQSILDNSLAVVRAVRRVRGRNMSKRVTQLLCDLQLAARSPDQEVRYLSGGNQQKIVLAKWLLTDPRVILLDEPTRGIDVGAKFAVYTLVRKLASEGHAVLLVSSELPELIGMSDRIVVLHDGRIAAHLSAGVDEETIARAASGLSVDGVAA